MRASILLAVAAAAMTLTSTASANKYDELVAKGFRWATADGPYACVAKEDVHRMANNPGDAVELKMIEQVKAYYLTPGTIVQVTEEDSQHGNVKNSARRDYDRSLDHDAGFSPNTRSRIRTESLKPPKLRVSFRPRVQSSMPVQRRRPDSAQFPVRARSQREPGAWEPNACDNPEPRRLGQVLSFQRYFRV